jgi:hypothetical protein
LPLAKGINDPLMDLKKLFRRRPGGCGLATFSEGIIAHAHAYAEQAGFMPRRKPYELSGNLLGAAEYLDESS